MYKSILIKGGNVFDGEKFFPADVLVENRQITRIGAVSTNADFVFNAAGMIVCPGLVDIHAHMAGVTDDDFAIPAESSLFPFGVTAAVEASACRGNREFLEGLLLDSRMFLAIEVRDDRACFEKTEKLLTAFGDRAIGVKVFFDTANPQLRSIAPLQQAVAFAQAHGLKVMVHSTGSPVPMAEIVKALRPGDILSHFYHGGNHQSCENDFEAYHLAKEKGVIIDVGMAGHIHTDFALLKTAISRGFLPDTLGSDITCFSAFIRGGNYGLTLCMSILKNMGVAEEALLPMVTANAAEAAGMAGTWGRLKVGDMANIAVLDWGANPYAFRENPENTTAGAEGYRCRLTVCQGKVVYRSI